MPGHRNVLTIGGTDPQRQAAAVHFLFPNASGTVTVNTQHLTDDALVTLFSQEHPCFHSVKCLQDVPLLVWPRVDVLVLHHNNEAFAFDRHGNLLNSVHAVPSQCTTPPLKIVLGFYCGFSGFRCVVILWQRRSIKAVVISKPMKISNSELCRPMPAIRPKFSTKQNRKYQMYIPLGSAGCVHSKILSVFRIRF
jgi:hypothetical protein